MSALYPLYRTLTTVMPYYAEERRRYHDFNHISTMLMDYARWEQHFDLSQEEEAILFDANLWHDAIYVVGAKDNEELSADLYMEFAEAMRFIGYTITEKHANTVKTAIEYTAKHFGGVPDHVKLDKPLRILLDLDLLGFARPYEEFVRLQKLLDEEAVAYGHDRATVTNAREAFLSKIYENRFDWLQYNSLPDC